jgi:hypothetical protein
LAGSLSALLPAIFILHGEYKEDPGLGSFPSGASPRVESAFGD